MASLRISLRHLSYILGRRIMVLLLSTPRFGLPLRFAKSAREPSSRTERVSEPGVDRRRYLEAILTFLSLNRLISAIEASFCAPNTSRDHLWLVSVDKRCAASFTLIPILKATRTMFSALSTNSRALWLADTAAAASKPVQRPTRTVSEGTKCWAG